MTKENRRQHLQKALREREIEAQLSALRQIRDDPRTAPETRLEAVKLLLEME